MEVQIHKGMYQSVSSTDALKTRLTQEGFHVFTWQDEPGAVYSEHSHPHDELIVVASGAITFTTANAEYELSSGDAMELPAGTVHGATNRGETAVTYLICTR